MGATSVLAIPKGAKLTLRLENGLEVVVVANGDKAASDSKDTEPVEIDISGPGFGVRAVRMDVEDIIPDVESAVLDLTAAPIRALIAEASPVVFEVH